MRVGPAPQPQPGAGDLVSIVRARDTADIAWGAALRRRDALALTRAAAAREAEARAAAVTALEAVRNEAAAEAAHADAEVAEAEAALEEAAEAAAAAAAAELAATGASRLPTTAAASVAIATASSIATTRTEAAVSVGTTATGLLSTPLEQLRPLGLRYLRAADVTMGCLRRSNPLRRAALIITRAPLFTFFILTHIFVNFVFLASYDPALELLLHEREVVP